MTAISNQSVGTCIDCEAEYLTYTPSRRTRCDDCQEIVWGRRNVLDAAMMATHTPKNHGQVLLW